MPPGLPSMLRRLSPTLDPALALAALASVDVGLWIVDGETLATTFTNERFEAILGSSAQPPEQLDGLALHTLDGPALAGSVHPARRALAERTAVVVMAAVGAPDGPVFRVKATAIGACDGEASHVVMAFVDASGEMAKERAYRDVSARLRTALEHAPIILWAADANGVVTLSEGAALAGLDVKPGELVGARVHDLYRDDPRQIRYFERALAGEGFSNESRVGDVVLDSWLGPLRDDIGRVVGVVGVSTDVTERSKVMATAIQADRVHALGTLAASVAHEINNPLSYALLSIEQIERGLRAGDVDHGKGTLLGEAVARVRDALDRIRVVTADMRSFSRPDTELELVDLRHAIERTLRLVEKDLADRATLEADLAPVPPVRVSEARLGQVVLNLLVNALQSLPAGAPNPRVRIETRVEGANVLFAVEDSGPGVDLALREKIFDPFFTTRPVGVGTGLGLFVCRNIVRGYAGDIRVREGGLRGARFEVRIPAAFDASGERASPKVGAAPVPIAAGPSRLLVVDDDPRLRRALVLALRGAGHEVVDAGTAAEGIELLLESPPVDLCLCDLMMQPLSGVDLFTAVTAARPELASRIVLMTGGAFTPETQAFAEAHASQCESKPFDVVAVVDARLGRRRSEASA